MPRQPDLTARLMVSYALIFVVGFIFLVISFRRTTLGVAGSRGESMLVELRDRIMRVSNLPRLPGDWYAEVVAALRRGHAVRG